MTELAVRDAYQPDRVIQRSGGIYERDIIDGWVQVMSDVAKLADYISETDFVPKSLRNKPAAIAACILTGRELGIGPMQSLKSIYMVQGVPSLSAEYKRARALAAGHEISIDETNATRCIIRGRRAGTDRWVTVTWNIDMAKRAKLDGKEIWRAYPQRMLQARASGELCDLLFPDASLGLATTEILEDGGIIVESGETVDAATGEVTSGTTPAAIDAPKPGRTAQRASKRPTGAAPAAGSAQAPQNPPVPDPASAQPAPSGDPSLPPLPGEEEAPSAPDDTDYDTPGTAATPQITAIWTVLGTHFQFGKDEKDQARMLCGQIIGRDLASTKDLSRNEARTILDTLGHWRAQAEAKGEDTRAYLIEMLTLAEEARRGE